MSSFRQVSFSLGTAAVAFGIFAVAATLPALASGSGISQLDSGYTTAINIARVIVAIIGVGLLVALVAEWNGHKNVGKMLIEFLGAAICIIFAINPTTVLGMFGVTGAVLGH